MCRFVCRLVSCVQKAPNFSLRSLRVRLANAMRLDSLINNLQPAAAFYQSNYNFYTTTLLLCLKRVLFLAQRFLFLLYFWIFFAQTVWDAENKASIFLSTSRLFFIESFRIKTCAFFIYAEHFLNFYSPPVFTLEHCCAFVNWR